MHVSSNHPIGLLLLYRHGWWRCLGISLLEIEIPSQGYTQNTYHKYLKMQVLTLSWRLMICC
jgi:hypothetical protein